MVPVPLEFSLFFNAVSGARRGGTSALFRLQGKKTTLACSRGSWNSQTAARHRRRASVTSRQRATAAAGMQTSAVPVALGGDPASWPAGKASSVVRSLRADGKPAPLTKAERIRRFGVDCGDGLVWAATWTPGGEYTKALVVKNVSKQVVKLKYKLPESKFFSMAFPETIKLTAGLSKTLQVRSSLRLCCSTALPRCAPKTTTTTRARHSPCALCRRSAARRSALAAAWLRCAGCCLSASSLWPPSQHTHATLTPRAHAPPPRRSPSGRCASRSTTTASSL